MRRCQTAPLPLPFSLLRIKGDDVMYEYPVNVDIQTIEGSPSRKVAIACPTLPELKCVGDGLRDAFHKATLCAKDVLGRYVAAGKPIPQPNPATMGQYLLRLPLLTVAKILLWNEMSYQGVNSAELAQRLRIDEKQVAELLDFTANVEIELIESALSAVGKRLVLSLAAESTLDIESRKWPHEKVEL
ncbi:hypothetical protein [Zymobacter palmae]|uniref:Uncharacterized conserved protein n=1 Tax=Zymobacter palmae TaxID=33074 RepID=A0A348HH87_9GAMM|nr:hypothetical protein [Zymobacter palmae]BBG30989.1 uncharacterized conserved protein [Zymobacter palmae]